MSEKRATTADSRKRSGDRKAEAKRGLDSQRRSSENIGKVMNDVSKLGTTGFSDTDRKVLQGADKIGHAAERIGSEDAKVTSVSAEKVAAHGQEMESVAKRAASEGAKADHVSSRDSRLNVAHELRAGYKEAESVASDISRGDKQTAATTRAEAKSISARVIADSRRRPSLGS